MEKQIIFKEYEKSDHAALAAVIREAWHYDEFLKPKTAAKMAKVFLNSCLINQTFTKVAVIEDKPVGIIMGKNIKAHKCKISLWIKSAISIVSLLLTKEGRKVSKIFSCVSEIDKELLQNTGKNYQGEIAFFAIDSKYREKGIGKKLFQTALSYMETERITDFYLFTDTSCNYQFYEHQGMKRRGEKTHTFHIKNYPGEITFYIYDYLIN